MNEKQLLKLLKKTVAKASAPKKGPRRTYDAALDATRSSETAEDTEAAELFQEMKRREF
ncbi:MAG: hypothetical protein NVS1B4_08750 [Gemmatimonadaceae bacterium]